jgi:hypothetical protein
LERQLIADELQREQDFNAAKQCRQDYQEMSKMVAALHVENSRLEQLTAGLAEVVGVSAITTGDAGNGTLSHASDDSTALAVSFH